MTNEKLDCAQKLDAFLASQQDVMAAVPSLRGKPPAAGNLKSSAEQKVTAKRAAAPAETWKAAQ